MKLALVILALAHGIIYATMVPLWGAPDEPGLYEYVALTARLGRIPAADERDLALEQAIVGSMAQQRFWYWVGQSEPVGVENLADARAYFPMPRQVGGDPPLYFALAALALKPFLGWPVEQQVYLLRLLNVLLLPAIVVCGWGAGTHGTQKHESAKRCESHGTERAGGSRLSRFRFVASATFRAIRGSNWPPFALALHPMFVATCAQVGNDSLANLIGAGLCWALLAQVGRTLTLRSALLICGLLVLGLLTKRTLAPFALVAIGWFIYRGWSGRKTKDERRKTNSASLPKAFVLRLSSFVFLALLFFGVQIDWRAAGGWVNAQNLQPAPRTGGDSALLLRTNEEALQPLPDIALAAMRGQALSYGALVRGDNVSGRLTIMAAGVVQSEQRFTVTGEQAIVGTSYLPRDTASLWISIAAESGTLEVDNLWLRGGRLPGNQLANGDLRWPALLPASPLEQLSSYSRLPELGWAIRSGYIQRPPLVRFAWWATLFESFWGRFGWLTVPMIANTFWWPVLAVLSGLAGIGTLAHLLHRRTPSLLRGQIGLAIAIVGAALALVVFNSLTAADGAPQGRYLFPSLVAIVLLMVWGTLGWVPERWRPYGLVCWVAFWSLFAGSTLWRLAAYYYG